MIIIDKFLLRLHFIFLLACLLTFGFGKAAPDDAKKELSCTEEATECDDLGIRHLPLNKTSYYKLTGAWALALLKTSDNGIPQSDGSDFIGYLSLTRIQGCKIKLSFQNIIFGTDGQKHSETLLVHVDGKSVPRVCRESALNEMWMKPGSREKRDDQLAGLASNIVSAIMNNGMHESHSRKEEDTVTEEDYFGKCSTDYAMKRSSKSNFWIKKHRDLKTCGKTIQKFASESGEVLWQTRDLQNYVETAEFDCIQLYEHDTMKRLECSHNVIMAETSEFTSNLTLTFLSSEEASNTNSEGFVEIFDFIPNSHEKSAAIKQLWLYEEALILLQTICRNSEHGLYVNAVLSFPKVLTILNTLAMENIVKLHQTTKSGTLCPENPNFITTFESILRDATSPAAASAKCQIMLQNDVPLNTGWASSLSSTVQPTTNTLKHCSDLLSLSSWTKSVLGVSALAGSFRSSHCRSQERDYDSCVLGDHFHFITKTLWIKAGKCLYPDKESQNQALWAIRGLTNLDSVGDHVTTVLASCINAPGASPEVKIASLRAIGRKMCNAKTSSWLQNLVFKEDRSAEFRIEAFKTILLCNPGMADELIEMVTQGNLDLKSSQVTSFVESYSKFQNRTNFLKLSRHFNFDLAEILGLKDKSKLEGDLIFDDSFLPRSLNLNLDSGFLRSFGGSAQLEFRQKNLEDILQPLIGPEGLKGSIQSILQDVIITLFDSLRNPENASDDEVSRVKRSLNIDDVKNSLMKVKNKVTGKLQAMVSGGLGNDRRFYSTYSFDPLFTDFDAFLQEYIDNLVTSLYTFIANYEMSSGFTWALHSNEALTWSFLGRRLSLRQHEGVIGTLKMSSHLSLFSLIKSPFNPSVDIKFNPNVGAYWYSSMEFDGNSKLAEAKVESPLHAEINLHLKMKPKTEEHLEFTLDLPRDSFHGYSVSIAKTLVVKNENPTGAVDPSHVTQFKQKGVPDHLVPKHPVQVEQDYLNCDEGFWKGLGLRSCFESSVFKGEKSILTHSKYGLAKADDNINDFKISLSTKNPGQNSFFLSALVEAEGSQDKREGSFVFGYTLSPHTTLRIMARGGTFTRSLEASVVNDVSVKRLEVRSNVDGQEHGMKAEILKVRDGGQVSIKPRLVISSPKVMEDALLDGYIAHYSSDKVKSFTIDLMTQGSLKIVYDVALKGTTEYRWKPGGEWLLSLKNLHLITPGLDFGMEAGLHAHESGAAVSCQVTWDGDVIILGGDYLSSDVTEEGGRREIYMHLLSPDDPLWDTKLALITSLYDGQLHNNLSIVNGPENRLWEFKAFHSTSWKFIYTEPPSKARAQDLWSRLLRKGRTVRITDVIHISIPSDEVDIRLDHSFQASDHSIENQASLLYRGIPYTLMTNFYDQSKERFKYHMEIEMDSPDWKFSYVDTLLERNEGDIVGQSVATMPSGRIYTSSSRLKYENTLSYLNLEITYDTHIRDKFEEFRISFRQTLESTPNNLNFMISLETPDPVLGVELSLEGLGTQPVYVFLKAFASGKFEAELTSRSTFAQTEVGLMLDLASHSRLVKGKIAVGRSLSGGRSLDGEVVMTSPQNPEFRPVTITVASSLESKDSRIYVVKGDLSLMEWAWSGELTTELGKKASDLQKFTIKVVLPDKSSFEVESHLLLNFMEEDQNMACKTEIKLPSGIIYKLSISGNNKFHKGSVADTFFKIDINSPFTKKMFLETHFTRHISEDNKDFSFFCKTQSEAHYWNELQIDFKWKQKNDTIRTVFAGKFGDKEVDFDSLGFYGIQNGAHVVKVVTEVHLPSERGVKQLKVSMEAEILSSLHPPGIKMSQVTYVQKNYEEIFKSSGDFEVNIPETTGSLVITHHGGRFTHQEYKLQGTFNGQELKFSIHGMVDNTPVRVAIQYLDGDTLKMFASYGGASFASVEFTSQLEGFSLRVREASSTVSKVTTNGHITFRNRKTSFHHSLRISSKHTSLNLQINSLRGKPVTISSSLTKLSRNKWKTEGKLEWGRMRLTYNDKISFRSFKDFDVEATISAPSFGLKDLFFHIISQHHNATSQTLSIKYMREQVIIHSGSFSITTSSLISSAPYEINAELVDVVIDRNEYSDFKFRQYHALLKDGFELESFLKRGGTRLAEIGLRVSEDRRKMLFAVCSTDAKCLRFTGQAQAFSHNSALKNFDVEVKILNSLLWKRSDDDIIQHTIALNAENKHEKGENIRLSAKISRSLCSDVLCDNSFIIGKHHAHLTASPQNIDLLYQTQNRTLLLKTSYSKGISKIPEDNSKLLKIQLWFDRLNKPDNVLILTTTYDAFDSDVKTEEVVESVLSHPYVERPVSFGVKLSTFKNSKVEGRITFDIYENPGNALQLNMKKDYKEGGYNLLVDLKREKENQPHVSLSAFLMPSPDAGLFDLKLDAPLLTSDQGSKSKNISFRYTCKMHVDTDITQMLCEVKSTSLSEDVDLSLSYAPEPCSGATVSPKVFGKAYKAYGAYCNSPLNVAAGISLTDDIAEDLRLKAGFVNSNEFEVDFLGVAKGDIELFAPYLLQGTLQPIQTPSQKVMEFKETLLEEWKYLVLRSRSTSREILKDLEKLSYVSEALSKPSQMTELLKIFEQNSRAILDELKNDELFQDISHTIETSVHVSSELLDDGIAFVEGVTGSSLHLKSFSFYVSKVQEFASQIGSSFFSFLQKEMEWFEDYARDVVLEVSFWIRGVYDYVVNESVVSEPLKWLNYKAKKLLSLDVWPPARDILEEVVHLTRQTLSFFYSGINEDIADKFSILIPLPEDFYTLESVLLTPLCKDSRKYSASYLHEEIKQWIRLLLDPQELIKQTLPPYSAQGVVVRDSLITFDGRAHRMVSSCPHLLMALKGRNGTTPIALASGRSPEESGSHKRELLLLVGKDVIRITPGKRIDVNDVPIRVPYQRGPFSISRDLNEIEVTLKDSWETQVLSLSCGTTRDACFINVNGWLFSDVKGLLGTYDYDPYDDYTIPDGEVSLNRKIWEASWRIDDNCSSAGALSSLETEVSQGFKDICTNLLLDKNSFVVPCHSSVNVHPYYIACLKTLQALRFTARRVSRSVEHPSTGDNHPSANKTTFSFPSAASFYDRDGKRVTALAEDSFNSIWRRSRQRLKMRSLDVRRNEKEALCNLAFAYSSVCYKHNVVLDSPSECDAYPLRPRNDRVDLKGLSIDLVVLLEEAKCNSFVHKYILQDLYKDLKEIFFESTIQVKKDMPLRDSNPLLLVCESNTLPKEPSRPQKRIVQEPSNRYNIKVATLGYGSTEGTPLAYYGGGASLLEPLENVERFSPEELPTDERRGTLEEAFIAATKFPFRKGTVRVIFVASCTDQDLPTFSSATSKELRKRRMIIFSMTNASLLHPRRTSEAFRNTIGVGSHHIYHLRRGAVHRKTTKYIIPFTNIAHMSLQSNGGIFTVESVRKEKRFVYYMQIFRQIFVKAIVESSEKTYTDAKNRILKNN